MDKISGLPDELLLKILSFLPTKVVVSTSVLSKRWKSLWMWLPKLHYCVSEESVLDFISENLPLHRAPVIESLGLKLCYEDIEAEDIKRWVEIAVSRYVRELEITYFLTNGENIFPSSFYSCKSLVILKFELMNLVDIPSTAWLPSLKTLQLNYVSFADEESFQDLLAVCPVLEDLPVSFCSNHNNMKEFTVIVPSLQKLSLYIPDYWSFDGYEIDTPSLMYLKLEDLNSREHYSLFKRMPQLVEAYIDGVSTDLKNCIRSITSVKHLTICSEYVYGDGFIFNKLEHLKLCVCKSDSSNVLTQLLKDSPSLLVLDISMAGDHGDADDRDADDRDDHDDMVCWNQPSDVPECLLSSLQIFSWSRYFRRQRDRDIAIYILKNAPHLQRATILADTSEHFISNHTMLKELAISSRASTKCELVFVDDVDDYMTRSDYSSDDSNAY